MRSLANATKTIATITLALATLTPPANATEPTPTEPNTTAATTATAATATSAPNASSLNPTPAPQPKQPEPAPPTYDGLLGDFGTGERSRLAKHGLTLDAHLVDEFAANLTGGIPLGGLGGTAVARGTGLSSEFGFGFDEDFGKLFKTETAGTLHFLMTTRFGSNVSAEDIGNLASVEEIYGDGQTTRITFLDYEQPLLHSKLDLRLGKYNQQNDFIVGSTYWGGDLYCFYMNNNICGTPAGIPIDNGVVANGSEGYTYYPSSQWGVRLKANLSKDTYVQIAAIQGNPLVNNQNGGLYLGFNGGTGTELPLEAGTTFRNETGDIVGNVRAGAYYDTSVVQDYATRAATAIALSPNETTPQGLASNAAAIKTIAPIYVRGRNGAYVQLDHLISGSSAPGKQGSTLFAAFEYADPETSLISTDFEIGAVRHGTFRSRPQDTLSLGFATENYNVRLQRLEDKLQSEGFAVPNTVQDQVIELNYGVQIAPWFVLRPNGQFVINPSGIKPNPAAGIINPARDAFVVGLGSYITF